jgi:hypothetical protein
MTRNETELFDDVFFIEWARTYLQAGGHAERRKIKLALRQRLRMAALSDREVLQHMEKFAEMVGRLRMESRDE